MWMCEHILKEHGLLLN